MKQPQETVHAIEPARRRFERQAADAEITRHHPLAGDKLENIQKFFALAETVEEHGHRAQIQRVRSEPDQMRSDARQFRQQNAGIFRARRRLDLEQLFHREAVAQIIGERREVIQPVGDRDGLRIGQRFAAFFDSGVQVADFGPRFDDRLAIQFEHHAQNAVRRRVLRPHVEDHGLGFADGGLDGGHQRRPSVGKSLRSG